MSFVATFFILNHQTSPYIINGLLRDQSLTFTLSIFSFLFDQAKGVI